MRHSNLSKKIAAQDGISLVELAIALVVIGFLMGGVLKGIELVESARLKAVLSQINEFRIAVSTFIDRYDALPGDYSHASLYIKENLPDGNNSGVIEGKGLDLTSEACVFWSHLAAANLIPSPGSLPSSGHATFGNGVPAAKIGGGFTVTYNPFEDMPGHWFLLGEAHGDKNNKGSLTPQQAFSLDKRIDNGDPRSGRMRAYSGVDYPETSCVNAQGHYNLKETRKVCIVYFQF